MLQRRLTGAKNAVVVLVVGLALVGCTAGRAVAPAPVGLMPGDCPRWQQVPGGSLPPRSSRTAETARDDAAAAAGLPSAGTWTTASTSELTVDYRLEVDNRVAGAVVVERDSISSQGSASEWKANLIQRCLP